INVDPDSYCNTCQKGFFNLDVNNPEGCQSCYCSSLTDQCTGVTPTTAMVCMNKISIHSNSLFNNSSLKNEEYFNEQLFLQ
ncbi:unnamed protein product, partial [Schistosoma mattheei]